MPDGLVRNVLIIEDEDAICIICKRVLDNIGFETDIVHDGKAAEKLVTEKDYNLILLDLRLPIESGIEFITWLRYEYPELAKKVILMTGSVMSSETMTLLKQSGQPYLLKPFRPE